MPELVGFQTMVILDPYGMTFDAVGVFGLDFQLLFKFGLPYCGISVHPALLTNAPLPITLTCHQLIAKKKI